MSGSRKSHSIPDNSRGIGFTKRKREATLYDAVAGRVSTQRFLPESPYTSTTRDIATSSSIPIPPDEVLFRRSGAPVRYIENDIYWADKYLKKEQVLPDSDLLKAVHVYASDYYGRALGPQGDAGFECMDETALLAVGILLEEAAKHVLGETGDLAFVEGEPISDNEADPEFQALHSVDHRQEKDHSDTPSLDQSKKRRARKKRKIQHTTE